MAIMITPSIIAKNPLKDASVNCQANAPFTKMPKPMFLNSSIMKFPYCLIKGGVGGVEFLIVSYYSASSKIGVLIFI